MEGPAPTGADGAPRPVVAVTANRRVDDGVHWEVIRRKYLQALAARAGVEVCILPTDEAEAGGPGELGSIAPALLDRVDGLVLTGDESNLDPAWYADRLPTGAPMPEGAADGRDRGRDGVSMRALAGALARGLPVLGICRGLHELNVFCGGTLWRHLPTDRPGLRHHEDPGLPRDDQYRPVHDVALAPDGVLATVFGAPSVAVSSLHFQGVRTLGAGLRVEATASDGLVEAVSVADAPTFQVAVQWHPEWHADTDGPSAALFAAFGAACRARVAARVPA